MRVLRSSLGMHRREASSWRRHTALPESLPSGLVETWGRISAEESFGPRVLNESLQIGLYAETLGALPIGWSDQPIEEVVAWQVP